MEFFVSTEILGKTMKDQMTHPQNKTTTILEKIIQRQMLSTQQTLQEINKKIKENMDDLEEFKKSAKKQSLKDCIQL